MPASLCGLLTLQGKVLLLLLALGVLNYFLKREKNRIQLRLDLVNAVPASISSPNLAFVPRLPSGSLEIAMVFNSIMN